MAKYPRWVYAIFPHGENGNTVGVYVGASAKPIERIRNHENSASEETPLTKELHRLMRENGFHYFILDEIKSHKDKNREYEFIQMFMSIQMKVFNTKTHLIGEQNGIIERASKRYGMKIRQLREEKGLTQEQFAKKIGTRQSTVGMWERCERSPRDSVKKQIAQFFDKSVQEIFYND